VAKEAEAASPLTGRKTIKLPRCPRATVSVQSNHKKSDSLNNVTSVESLKKYEDRMQFDDYGYSQEIQKKSLSGDLTIGAAQSTRQIINKKYKEAVKKH
jgi:hypothetical protein